MFYAVEIESDNDGAGVAVANRARDSRSWSGRKVVTGREASVGVDIDQAMGVKDRDAVRERCSGGETWTCNTYGNLDEASKQRQWNAFAQPQGPRGQSARYSRYGHAETDRCWLVVTRRSLIWATRETS